MKPFYLLFLLISLNPFVQYTSQVSPFTDYNKCLYGFRSYDGDTLYEPQFDRVHSLVVTPYSQHNYSVSVHKRTHWLVSKNGRVGLLDVHGEEVFPVVYESLDLVLDSLFIFQKNGKKGLINLDRQEVLSPDFDRIDLDWFRLGSDGGDFYLTLVKSNKTGIYRTDGGIVIPTEYDWVTGLEDNVYIEDTVFRYQKWMLWKNGQVGIAHLSGEVFVPVSYDNVTPAPVGIENDEVKLYYLTHDYEGDSIWEYEELTFSKVRLGLLDEKGKQLLPMEYDQIQLFHIQEENASQVYVLFQKKKKQYLKNLNSNKEIELSCDFVSQCGNYFIAYSEKTNSVYDQDLNLVSIPEQRIISLGSLDENSCLDDLLRTEKYVSKKTIKKAVKSGLELPLSKNLYDLKKKRQLPKDYGWIKSYDYPEEGQFFLAFSQEKIKVKYLGMHGEYDTKIQYLDIYDRSFNLIKHLPSIEIYDWGYEGRDDRYLVLFNEDGKMGVIGKNGKTYLDFEYDQIEPFHGGYCQFRKCDYLIEKDKKIGLWNSSKGILVDPQYDVEPKMVGENYVFEKDDRFVLIDTSGNVLVDSSTAIFSHLLYDSLGNKVISRVGSSSSFQYATYVVKDSKLYRYEQTGLILMDETALDFQKGLVIIRNYLVDKQGRVFYVGQSSRVQEVGAYFLVNNEDELLLLDQERTVLQKFNAYAYNVEGSDLYILTDSGTGVWNLESRKWLVEAIYADVIQANDSLFWVKEKDGYQSDKWKLRIGPGQLKSVDVDLIVPLRNSLNLYRWKGKFGLLDNQGEVVFEPENDYLVSAGGKWLFSRSGKWGIWSEGGNPIEPVYTDVTWDWKSKKWWVWNEDQVGVLNENLDWIMPLTDASKVSESKSNAVLVEETMKSGYIGDWGSFSLLSDQRKRELESRLVWFNISNRRITEANCPLYYSATGGFHSGGNLFYPYNSGSLVHLLNEKTEYKQMVIVGFGGDFHTEKLEVEVVDFYEAGHYSSNKIREISYQTFKWENGWFKEVELKELFVAGDNPIPLIQDMLYDAINKKQTFGSSCLSGEFINQLMTRFSIGTNGIVFHQLRNQNDWIELSYDELKEKGLELLF